MTTVTFRGTGVVRIIGSVTSAGSLPPGRTSNPVSLCAIAMLRTGRAGMKRTAYYMVSTAGERSGGTASTDSSLMLKVAASCQMISRRPRLARVDDEPTGAVFAEDRRHRLYLWRRWSQTRPWAMFIGLNPSSANEIKDDPTVRRCISFAARWGYGGMFMCNVFTLVSTDPKKLNEEEPLVRGAHLALMEIRKRCDMAVAAWGDLILKVRVGEERVERIKQDLSPLHCLGLTLHNQPKHPLYMPYSSKPFVYC